VSRVPLRLRLALAFAVATALVLALVGSLLYVRLGDSLLEQLDESLEQSVTEALVVEEGFVQRFGPEGELESMPPLPPVLTEAERQRAENGPFSLTRESIRGFDGAARLHVARRGADVVVAGASLEDRQEALDGLLAELLVLLPLAVVLAALVGYLVAGAALRPVEAMRRQADEISSDEPGRRLPLPLANDEIRRLGETLNDMLSRLEAGLARERRFVADASHELRTPLASLRTELELALRRPRSEKELSAALRSAAEEVERVVGLAENLLVLARADDGRLPLDTSPVVVRELLDAVAGRYDSQATALGRSIEVEGPSDWALTGDRLRLEQALGNLVDNALRHGAGTVRIEALVDSSGVEVRVADEGGGFSPTFLPYAFERFSREDVARAEGGAGLGLAIVEAVTRAHGGTATAENSTSGGASVHLRLPGAVALPERHHALISRS
jgi:two-component system, OmpR family, sensor kinase